MVTNIGIRLTFVTAMVLHLAQCQDRGRVVQCKLLEDCLLFQWMSKNWSKLRDIQNLEWFMISRTKDVDIKAKRLKFGVLLETLFEVPLMWSTTQITKMRLANC